jgi:hypothetical protein
MEPDIVVDANVMRLYGVADDPLFKVFFAWLRSDGVLACSQKMLVEYGRTGSSLIAALLDQLLLASRLRKYAPAEIKAIKRGKYKFRSNYTDHVHVRLVMCTYRRLCLSQDENLRYDVNNFPGYAARAAARPEDLPYA